MITDRPYRKGIPVEQAIEELSVAGNVALANSLGSGLADRSTVSCSGRWPSRVAMRVAVAWIWSLAAVTAITNANPGVFTVVGHGYTNGQWLYVVQ